MKHPLPAAKRKIKSIQKLAEHNGEDYDLSQPLEPSAEDVFPAVDHSGCSHGNALPRLQERLVGGGRASAGVVSSGLSVVKIKLVKIKAASYAEPLNQ